MMHDAHIIEIAKSLAVIFMNILGCLMKREKFQLKKKVRGWWKYISLKLFLIDWINTEANQGTIDLFMADLPPYGFDEKVMIH